MPKGGGVAPKARLTHFPRIAPQLLEGVAPKAPAFELRGLARLVLPRPPFSTLWCARDAKAGAQKQPSEEGLCMRVPSKSFKEWGENGKLASWH